MKKPIISIMIALIMVIGMAVPTYAYWPTQGANPYPAGAGSDVTQFVENGIIYVAYTVEANGGNRYQLVVMKKDGSSQWTPVGDGVSYTQDEYYYKFGEVEHPSIYVHNGVPYVAYIDKANYEYNPTVIKYNSGTNSWDIVGSRQIAPDPQGSYSIDSNHQIVANSNGSTLYYSADYVTMYVSASGTPYIAINEHISRYPYSTNKVVVMEYSGGWNTVGFAGFGDYICKGTPAIIHADGKTYVAYYETDTSTSSYKDYLVVQHSVAIQAGPPTPEATSWARNLKIEVNWSDKVQFKYDDGFLYLCFVNTNEELEVVKYDTFEGSWSSLGEIPFDTSEEDYSMAVFDGTPYVAYMGSSDNTARVAAYNGTGWENLIYNDDTALPPSVNDINLSNYNNVLYLTGTNMYGNLYTHYYNLPVIPVDAAAPQITSEPADKTVNVGETADLTVAASGTGALSYQWYSNGTESTAGAAAIANATGSGYSAPTGTAGTTYYYCVVTNTDPSVTGVQTATANTRFAKVAVADMAVEPIDQIISAVNDAIENGQLTGNGSSGKLSAFVARLGEAKAAIEAGDKKAAINILESIYKQVDGKPSPKDIVVGDAADEIAQMIQNLINSLK